jgi:hypothetical protein
MMRKFDQIKLNTVTYSLILLLTALSQIGFSQTVVWSDNFDAPSGGVNNNNGGVGWTLNSGGTGTNEWYIITPSSNLGCTSTGNQMHISCDDILCGFFGNGPNDPIYNASNSNNRSAVSPNISTVAQNSLVLSFEFVCQGVANQDYGLLAFSADGGTNWTEFPERYEGVSTCSTKVITVPAQFLNIPNFKIRFRWIESNSGAGLDPPFSVDNIRLTSPTSTCTPPTVSAGSNVSICSGQSTTIGGAPTATGGNPANYVYTWSPATGLSSTSIANPTANPTTTTTYTVSVNGGDATCTATSSVTVTVNTPDVLAVSPSGNQSICPGGSVQLSAANGFTNYSWSTPAGIVSGQSITASQAGSYQVTATDPDGCTSTSTSTQVSVTSVPAFSISSAADLDLCPGENVLLSGTPGFTNYVWTTPTGNLNGSSISAAAAGNYGLSASFGTCPVTATSVTVVIVSAPALTTSPSGAVTVCPGQSVTLTGLPGFSNYQWNTPAGVFLNNIVNASTPGEYVLSADYIGCTIEAQPITLSAISIPALNVTPSGQVNVCPGETPSLTATSGFSNYVWSTPSGNQSGSTITASTNGAYSVTANFLGCTANSSVVNVATVVVPSLVINANGPISICPGGDVELSATSGFTNYNWSTPSGNQTGISINAQTAGNYTVSATFSGCAATSSPLIVATIATPALSTTPSGTISICNGASETITAAAGFTNYSWSTPTGAISGTTVEANQAGVYQLSADFEQCTILAAPIVVNFSAPFVISVSPNGPINLCGDETVTLVAESGFSNYQWSTSEFGQSLEVGLSGGYSVSAEDASGCIGTSGVIQVNQIDNPVAGFTYQQNLDELYEINFTNTSENATSYLWNFNSSNSSTDANPSFDFPFDNIWPVSLIATNTCGSDTFLFDVVVIKTSLEDISGLEINVLQLADGSLQITGKLDVAQVLTLDVLASNGQLMWQGNTAKSNFVNIQVPGFEAAKGLYFVRIQSGGKARILRYLRQ